LISLKVQYVSTEVRGHTENNKMPHRGPTRNVWGNSFDCSLSEK